MLEYLNDLYVYMYMYQCMYWYKFENDEVDRIFSCKCTVLCADIRSGRMVDRVLHVESNHMTCASLCYLHNIAIFQYVTQNSTFTRKNTYHFIILELLLMYTLSTCIQKYMYTERSLK